MILLFLIIIILADERAAVYRLESSNTISRAMPVTSPSGLFSSLAYGLHSVVTRNKVGALGASGAVYALLSFFVYKFPETKVSDDAPSIDRCS